MLIRFALENWLSFRDKAEISMLAIDGGQHEKRVANVSKYPAQILPCAAIYGGNASGKSNFVEALVFARGLVVRGTRADDDRIPAEPFRLAPDCLQKPCCFEFEILIDETIYEYSFAVNSKEVLAEKLVEITDDTEKVLYERVKGYDIKFDESMQKKEDEFAFLKFAFQGTRDNQLFLTNAISQKVTVFKPVYSWFKDTLTIISPESRYGNYVQYIEESSPIYNDTNKLLGQFDTGISRLVGDDVSVEKLSLPAAFLESIKEGEEVSIPSGGLLILRLNGEIIAKSLGTYHNDVNGKEVKFDLNQESDGSLRLINILPAFIFLVQPELNGVYVIDEFDRSLHTLLTRALLEFFLDGCSSETRSQLVFTTHDVMLMDQNLLRTDEMWLTEREKSGNSILVPLSDYGDDIEKDQNVRESYLQGRMGGIPRILIDGVISFSSLSNDKEDEA